MDRFPSILDILKVKIRFASLLVVMLALLIVMSGIPISQAQPYINQNVGTFAGQRTTYSAVKVAFAPAASATDFFTIIGSATAPVRVLSISCNGTSTAAATALVQVVKRSAADTGGTATNPAAVPLNSTLPAATAVVSAYTVNPSALGTSLGPIAAANLTTTTAASTGVNGPTTTFDFANQNVILHGVAETLALNANAASFTSGASLNCSALWSEN